MGGFSIDPVSPATSTRRYEPDTNVLHTEFETESGAITVTDFIPKAEDGPSRAQSIHLSVAKERIEPEGRLQYVPRLSASVALSRGR